ncbi:metal ABC transporter permease [Gordonia polyisoprenivorans]|uniref:metal ABC transporter permease n=1 Tax=Gordonia polyisoprenivorans TaxID=84595 RepID=UPI001B8CB691|nr:metal ABC transporter permease [Gordonia polyisoprenivorans]QUD83277.1 metal ABC transporter permease [Gordonia polyisoprenivorans]
MSSDEWLTGFFVTESVQTALLVGGFVAAVAAVVGVFTVVRGQSFAGHALADLGAVGGSASFLLGISQLWGFVGAGVLAALLMEVIGIRRIQGRDVATGVILGLGLGLTSLLLYLATTNGSGASHDATVSVLFGSLFVIDRALVPVVVALGLVALALVAAMYRWLQLDLVDHDLATAAGVRVRLSGCAFLIALALAVELSSLTIGVILSTALLIGPPATALLVTRRFSTAILLSVVLGVAATWLGCLLSYESHYWAGTHGNWPVSFCIVTLVFLAYLLARVLSAGRRRHVPVAIPVPS